MGIDPPKWPRAERQGTVAPARYAKGTSGGPAAELHRAELRADQWRGHVGAVLTCVAFMVDRLQPGPVTAADLADVVRAGNMVLNHFGPMLDKADPAD